MAKQDRAIRTRRIILEAAASVFEVRGYQAATISEILTVAGVTKGALYFHFDSKDDLALGVLQEQDHQLEVPPQTCKSQEFVDVGALHAYRIETDPLVRSAVALSMDAHARGLDRSGPFIRWSQLLRTILLQAKDQGELLPHVVPAESAEIFVGAFGGTQAMSRAVEGGDQMTLAERISQLYRHILPSLVLPSVLMSLDLSPNRGATVAQLIDAAEETTEVP
ncbi:A-factor receptor protein [Streptomyces sp. YIM 130001]|uniref:ScbR family autoregulator-binding transcription factor n=1 Tax=Streptomyces sp. YIM 130001 TaxID=2259644 RepID=UPI000E65C4C4|nr:ScbR family autoregulator-binding transcription factor [Streptomyces sp. YIM 130001]RII06896.1 A-factor receptor protein [Streptomyces sp. YIM 130001]